MKILRNQKPAAFCLALIAILPAIAGCASKARPFVSNPFPLLLWLGESTTPAGTVYPQLADSARFGSLSGLAPDAVTNQWVAVIDDRDHSRIAWLSVDYAKQGLSVSPVRVQELR